MLEIRIVTTTEVGALSEREQIVRALEAINFAPMGNSAISTGVVATTETAPAPKRQTAAEKKAAEKAAAEAEAAAAMQQGIQSGGERTDPADAADEAADTKASTPEPIKLTHDSVRALLGGYVQGYGMSAAQEDGAKMIGIAKISDLKDDQAVFAKAVLAIAQGIESNPYKREIAGDGITAEKLAELKPIVTAAMAVK